MKIKKHILITRSILFWQDGFMSLLWLGIIASLLFLIGIELETVFYFSPTLKMNGLYIIYILLGVYVIHWLVKYFRSESDQLVKYKVETISLYLGKVAFPDKKDTILNALQLESNSGENESKELSNAYINKISEKLKALNYSELLKNKNMDSVKKRLLAIWMFLILFFSFTYQSSANSFYRWINPTTKFHAPKPFSLMSLSSDIHILGGEKSNITIKAIGANPDTVLLQLTPLQAATQERDSLQLIFSAPRDSTGNYQFELPELFQDYTYSAIVNADHFWEAWEKVASIPSTIFVTDRPFFESFLITVVPPKYSGLITETQVGNIAVVHGLKGSTVQIYLSSNRILESAFLDINGEKIDLSSTGRSASGNFQMMESGEFTVNLVDERGITNRDPVPYSLEIIPDHDPSLFVIKPSPVIELGSNQSIPIHIEIEDDYGFSNLQVAYEVRRPAFLMADPYVAMFTIHDLNPDTVIQTIRTLWDLSDMFLMPEDEVHFHFELTDNDNISGPKKTVSSTFIARVPSLADLYELSENNEDEFMEKMITGSEEFQDLQELFESLELESLKTKELDWDQQQSVKNALEQAKEELANLEKMTEAIESITKQAEKHDLFSSDLLDKFKELSELIQAVIPEDMMSNMENLQEALENMDMKQLQNALSELSENMAQIEQDLDRYLEIFKRLQAEQKMDELQTRMQQLFDQEQSLDREINQANDQTDQSTLERLAQEEKRNFEELDNLKSLMEEASDLVEPYSDKTSDDLSEMANSSLMEQTENSMTETMQNLTQQQPQQAQSSSQASLQNMEMMMQQVMQMQQGFQKETVDDMTEKFQALIQDMLYLSSQEEQLRSDVKSATRNSPRLREMASRQQVLQDQLNSIMSQMMELSKETFSITPEIGRGVGKANASMQEAKSKLTERNVNQAGTSQEMAMAGLNEAALGLFNSIQAMQQSGSASGYEQFLQMMQQMAGQQQGANQQGMQLGMGQMAAAAQQQMMQQMLQKQQDIRKSLEQMMNEMRHSGQKGMGDLSGIGKEMDEVIKDLQRRRFSRKTQERQQRILSRMLDSQTSMTQRGYKDERKSTSAETLISFEGPGGLPADMGQRQNLALQALNKSINAGYSREHQTMIKRYFNSLSQLKIEQEIIEGDIEK